jgi:hypothetical protein
MAPKVLIVLTSAIEIPKLQKPTGWYLVCSYPSLHLGLLNVYTSITNLNLAPTKNNQFSISNYYLHDIARIRPPPRSPPQQSLLNHRLAQGRRSPARPILSRDVQV